MKVCPPPRNLPPGRVDFSGANADAIETSDITTALAVPRGARIEPAAPPTVRLPIFFEFNSASLRPEDRLGTIGHGENDPVADNGSGIGRQRNRRVELINLGSIE